MLVPVSNHEEAEEHTTKMRSMGYTVARGIEGREELNGHITKYEPLGLDGEGAQGGAVDTDSADGEGLQPAP